MLGSEEALAEFDQLLHDQAKLVYLPSDTEKTHPWRTHLYTQLSPDILRSQVGTDHPWIDVMVMQIEGKAKILFAEAGSHWAEFLAARQILANEGVQGLDYDQHVVLKGTIDLRSRELALYSGKVTLPEDQQRAAIKTIAQRTEGGMFKFAAMSVDHRPHVYSGGEVRPSSK